MQLDSFTLSGAAIIRLSAHRGDPGWAVGNRIAVKIF